LQVFLLVVLLLVAMFLIAVVLYMVKKVGQYRAEAALDYRCVSCALRCYCCCCCYCIQSSYPSPPLFLYFPRHAHFCSYNGLGTGSEHEVSFSSSAGGGGDSTEMTSTY